MMDSRKNSMHASGKKLKKTFLASIHKAFLNQDEAVFQNRR